MLGITARRVGNLSSSTERVSGDDELKKCWLDFVHDKKKAKPNTNTELSVRAQTPVPTEGFQPGQEQRRASSGAAYRTTLPPPPS